MEVHLKVCGTDDYEISGTNYINEISRHPTELVSQLINGHHQYPDGVLLFLGTMYVPTQDRHGPNSGFTHIVGDKVTISSSELGHLTNWINYCDEIEPWKFGIGALITNLTQRNLL